MFSRAKNGRIKIDGTDMHYIAFGKGKGTLIMIPGLSDGLTTVKGKAAVFSRLYKEYSKTHRVYVFSRRNILPEDFTSRDMARDVKSAMDILGITQADVLGVSQGGTVAQYLALDYPDAVRRLVLAVTYARPNDTVNTVVSKWIGFAQAGDHGNLMIDTAEHSYSAAYLDKYRKYYPLLGKIGRPKGYDRFINMAKACLEHNCFDRLGEIKCPTLIIGGGDDRIVTCAASVMMSTAISASRLYVYPQYGHAAYEEAKDFNRRVLEFITQQP